MIDCLEIFTYRTYKCLFEFLVVISFAQFVTHTVSFTDVSLLAELYLVLRKNELDSKIKIINNMKSGSRNIRLLELCKDMFSTHEVLFYTSVSWLLKGNVLN